MSSNVRRVEVKNLVSRQVASVQARAILVGTLLEGQLESLLESDEVEGDHRLQIEEALGHLRNVMDMLGPVEEFEEQPQPASAAA